MTRNHTPEKYGRSTRYGSNDELFVEVTTDEFGCVHVMPDEDDPDLAGMMGTYLTLRPDQAEALAGMLEGAVKHLRAERAARKAEAA